jgi:hypothetical protein
MSHSQDENLKSMFTATPDCPDTSALASMLEEGDHSAHWKHVHGCAHCLGEMELLRSFLTERVSTEEQPHVSAITSSLKKNSPAQPAPWWKLLLKPWTLTPAIVAAAVAIFVVANVHDRPGGVVLNSGDQVVRSQSIHAVAPVGDLSAAPEVLAWSAVAGSANYKVQVLEVDRTLLWTAMSRTSNVSLEPEIKRQIVPGKALLWKVEALDASGNFVASSGLTEFRVR